MSEKNMWAGHFEPLVENRLPDYAREMLWLKPNNAHPVKINPDGSFHGFATCTHLELRWANPAGAVLTTFNFDTEQRGEQLDWDGWVRLGGFIERTHILEHDGLPLMIIELSGGAYPPTYRRWASREDLIAGPFSHEEENIHDPSRDGHWYSLLLPLESPLVDFVHHALVNGNAIDCLAEFSQTEMGWHELVGLPLIVDSLTLLSSGGF
jgi:hypothetical protein